MNSKVVQIADKIARNEDVTMDEFKFITWYIYKANKGKQWNPDDVVSNFVLDVREHYNPDFDVKSKEGWIYAHIKWAITNQAIFDYAWTLNNPVPVSTDWYEVEWIIRPDKEFQINIEQQEVEDIYKILHTPLEKDIYTYCILWNVPVAHIAKEHKKSAQWWKIIKDRISKRIKDYIENKPK